MLSNTNIPSQSRAWSNSNEMVGHIPPYARTRTSSTDVILGHLLNIIFCRNLKVN